MKNSYYSVRSFYRSKYGSLLRSLNLTMSQTTDIIKSIFDIYSRKLIRDGFVDLPCGIGSYMLIPSKVSNRRIDWHSTNEYRKNHPGILTDNGNKVFIKFNKNSKPMHPVYYIYTKDRMNRMIRECLKVKVDPNVFKLISNKINNGEY